MESDPRTALAAAAEAQGESLAGLSRLIGRNAAYLQQFVTRGSPRRLEEGDRRRLAAYLGLSEHALGGPPAEPVAAIAEVRRLDVAASAGPGALPEDDAPLGSLHFDKALLRALGVRERDAAIIRAEGDSMMPGIADGDLLLVDGARRLGRGGGVFVFRLDGVLLVKRLARTGERIEISSDNPAAPAIAPRLAAEVELLGEVVWLSRALR